MQIYAKFLIAFIAGLLAGLFLALNILGDEAPLYRVGEGVVIGGFVVPISHDRLSINHLGVRDGTASFSMSREGCDALIRFDVSSRSASPEGSRNVLRSTQLEILRSDGEALSRSDSQAFHTMISVEGEDLLCGLQFVQRFINYSVPIYATSNVFTIELHQD